MMHAIKIGLLAILVTIGLVTVLDRLALMLVYGVCK